MERLRKFFRWGLSLSTTAEERDKLAQVGARLPPSRAFARRRKRRLQPFADHVFQQVADAVAVAPFVVVPAHQLEEALVQFNAGALVENRGGFAMDEVAC